MPIIKKKEIVKGLSLVTMGISTVLSIITLIYVLKEGRFIFRVGHWDAPWGIEFQITAIEGMMAVLFTVIATLVIWYSVYVIEKDIKSNRPDKEFA